MKRVQIFNVLKGALIATAMGLAACGGGGGGSDAPLAPVSVKVFSGALSGPGSRDGVGAAAQFNRPRGVAQDGAGNVYVADSANHTIRKITPQGIVTTLAGAAGQAGSADGTGSAARFSFPRSVAATDAGTVYVSDAGNHTLRKITAGGAVTTIAGVVGQAGNEDGAAATARFTDPGKLAVDQDGTLYVAANYAVRKVSLDGIVSTFAGKSGEQGLATGNAAQTRFGYVGLSVAVGGGNVYVGQGSTLANSIGNIRKFNKQGDALSFGTSADGVRGVFYPADIAADSVGSVYVVSNGADQQSRFLTTHLAIDVIASDGRSLSRIAGAMSNFRDLRAVDGPGASARFVDPAGIAVGPDGRIVVAEVSTNAIRAVDGQASHVVTTLAGGGDGYADGAVASARFNGPSGLAASADGTLYVADTRNHVVRKISPAGLVSTLAPIFEAGGGLSLPASVAVAGGGTVYVLEPNADAGRRVLAYDSANRGSSFYSASGNILAIASDPAGNLYVAENGQIALVSPGGSRRVLASGIDAQGLAADAAGNVYFTSGDRTVGVVDPSGRVQVLAGRANEAGSVDAIGQDARFDRPVALALDAGGSIYVADGLKIRRITPQGAVTTVADVATLHGVTLVSTAGSAPSVIGLAWTSGALYGILQGAVIQVAPLN